MTVLKVDPLKKVKCSCKRCSEMVSPSEYTFPECKMCYLNLDGVCEYER